jgi:V/A-type H+-transporting ATPase subunit F
MKKINFITPVDARNGFKLTGAKQYITRRRDMINLVKQLVSEPDTGIIMIDERLLTEDTEAQIKSIEQGWNGILLVLPSPERPEGEIEDYATRLMRRAIGYHVRLRT